MFDKTLFAPGDRVLVAVSGGVDSMTLLHLLVFHARELGLEEVAAAHCNFTLRGLESDRETKLVEQTCAALRVRLFVERFDTRAECSAAGQGVQQTARRLRYDFFERLASEHGFTKVAVAHHADDAVETFFINLMRGTGLRGLTGIARRRGRIVRPLLDERRVEIERYASAHGIEWRDDSSNKATDYLRNRLRNDLLPRFSSCSSSFAPTMTQNIERLDAAERFIATQIEKIRSEYLSDQRLAWRQLQRDFSTHFGFVAYELLRDYGLSGAVVEQLLACTESGKEFLSATHRVVVDRDDWIVTDRHAEEFVERTIERDDQCVEYTTVDRLFSLETPPNAAYIAADALQWPLRLRRWQAGDWFVPLGMSGQKKVSDALVDWKVSLPEKEQQGVLVSGEGTIVWVVGRRLDDRFKVTEQSRSVIKITL